MKIMCFIKITCPSNNGIVPPLFAPTLRSTWLETLEKHSDPYFYSKFDFEGYFYTYHVAYSPGLVAENGPYQGKTNQSEVLLFDSEEELNVWANNCRLTDPQLIADQEIWKTAHGITFTYEYYSLSPTTGPDPVV